MPGRDYARAHALLQESLAGDVSYPSLHLIHGRSGQPLRKTDTPKGHAQRPASLPPRQQSPEALDVRHSTHLLPPTPPDNLYNGEDIDPSFGLSKPLQSSDQSSSTRPSTPFNIGTSITPDTQLTPPSLSGFGERKSPGALNNRSSHAESFTTAREEQGSRSSLGGSRHFLPLHGIREGGRGSPSQPVPLAFASHGARISTSPLPLGQVVRGSPQPTSAVRAGRNWERRRLHDGTRPIPNDLTFLDDRLESDINLLSEDSPHSWFEASSSDGNVSAEDGAYPRTPDRPESNDKEADFLNMTPPKRLPSSSKAAAVIKAEIRESPDSTPRREHRLRHYHKNDALRDGQTDSDSHAPTLSNAEGSPVIKPTQMSTLRDEDVRARTRSSLVASLPTGLTPTSPLWRRTKSLSASKSPRMTSTGRHSRQISDTLSDVLGDHLHHGVVPLDQLYGLSDGDEHASDIAPSELRRLHRRQSSGHLTADDALDRQSGIFSTRHTRTQPSPFSEVSEGLILNDVRAISIVPHNNDSLLVVNQQRSAHTSVGISQGQSMPQATIAPSNVRSGVPDQVQDEAAASDQPHEPLVPDIAVLPPTPAKRDTGSNAQVPSETRPGLTRQDSIMKRAIRTFAAPRAGLLRRHTTKSRGSQSKASNMDQSPRKRLHPFWQPRGFWEDFSDTGEVLHRSASPTRDVADERPTQDTARSAPAQEDSQRTRSIRQMFAGNRTSLHRPKPLVRSSSNPEPSLNRQDLELGSEQKHGLPKSALQRLASLKATVKSMAATKAEPSNSQRRRLRLGLKEKIQERTKRREEQRREQERARIRDSIGPRFYVDTTGISDD